MHSVATAKHLHDVLLNISTSVITYGTSIQIVKIDTQPTSMEPKTTRLDSEMMETLVLDCIVGKAPCKLSNLDAIRDHEGRTLLHWVAYLGLKEEVEYVLSLGVNPNAADDEGRTALHITDNYAIAEILLRSGADPNARDKYGRTPLHYAKQHNVAVLLISAGADVNAKDNEGNVPLHTSKVVETLIAHGADPNVTNRVGLPPVYYVLKRGDCQAVKLLHVTDRNIIINTRGKHGETLLHVATKSGCKEAVEYLIKYGIDVNARDEHGDTPLHIACYEEDAELIRLLLSHGANPRVANNNGLKPWMMIASMCRKGHSCITEIVDLLEEEIGAFVKSAFHAGQLELLRLLLHRGIQI